MFTFNLSLPVHSALLAAGLFMGSGAQAADAPVTRPRADITLAGAERVLDAAFSEAERNQWVISAAVVDSSGELVAFRKADGAIGISPSVAIGKARTAALLRQPSKSFEDFINGGRPSFLSTPEILPLEGGVPIAVDGLVVGAVGVSGAHGPNDSQVASKASEAVAP
ncbi:GlcG/HbpS family heme-binding protein [Pseudomonas sp. NY15364]|uniref:GlcG/HbpS family heme-binding protein n=1 Tax=Pseudomonas sp. NY15364 TaxID=3400353 RepID=UPI003A879597